GSVSGMTEPSDPGPPDGSRRRAPTITIDTTAVNIDHDVEMLNESRPPQEDAVSPMTTVEPSGGLSHVGQQTVDSHHPDISLDSKDSRPTSPHNISSPVLTRANDDGTGFLSVPSNHTRPRQNSTDSQEVSARSISSHGETTMVASSHTQVNKFKVSGNDKIMKDDKALTPDAGTEGDFDVRDNPFAFSPGQLNKMFNPKSLAAFYKLGGLRGLEKGLRTDRKTGLSPDETHLTGHVTYEEATSKMDVENMEKTTGEPKVESITRASTRKSAPSDDTAFVDRLRVFRDNRLPAKKGKSLLQLVLATYNDNVLILLSVAAVVSLAVGLYQTFDGEDDGGPKVEWVEGVAIVVAIALVVIVGSLNDFSKERKFVKLNKVKQDRNVRVVRSGRTKEISVFDILVGDVVHLEPGDMVPADGVLIDGFNVKCDESQTTGESDIIRKRPADEVYVAIQEHESLKKMDPFIQSGARIMEGVGTYMVTSTGVYSTHGRTLMALNDDPEMTPLQAKLNVVATWIAKLGSAVGLLLFIVLFIQFLVRLPHLTDVTPARKGQMFLNIFIMVVTIIVVAVPEGLPLAVTLALAFATTRMLKDANLVRHLKACEVMGNATTICSDKTGTLTQNKMQIVSATIGTSLRFGGGRPASRDEDVATTPVDTGADITAAEFASMLSAPVKELLVKSIALNSTAFEGQVDGQNTFIGSKTETALLLFARDYLGMSSVGEERENARTLQMVPFDSGRKCMGVVVGLPGGRARLYVKGASEIVLAKCTQTLRDAAVDGSVASLSKNNTETIAHLIEGYATRSLRTIGICFRDFEAWPPKDARSGEGGKDDVDFTDVFRDMSFIGMVGIQDPLREGVYESVKLCQQAGVVVRMVTGDNKLTAQAIAKECGILQAHSVVMEGPDFRNLSKLQQEEVIPTLHVLARSSPEDKRILVKRLKDKGETVAVTGDGTNDAPALKMADVGFSMGITGTEVAKEASAIILMDDNFASIVKALKWGRAVNDAVKRFLQFQLTVNITAVVLTFVTAVSNKHDSAESNRQETAVLTAVQLLWVNLIMDTLAALALATDPPHDSVLKRLPEPKGSPLVSITMWKMILGQAAYQLVITFLLYYGIPQHWFDPFTTNDQPLPEEVNTMVFNTFVWMQIFNQWNNRRLDNRFNIFEGLTKNWIFLVISLLMCGGQVLIIFFGGAAFQIASRRQDSSQWAMAVLLGLLSIPMGVVLRLIPDEAIAALVPGFLRNRGRTVPGLTVSDEEMGQYPEPLAEVRDELKFIRRMKGGRLNNLRFKIQQHTETVLRQRSRSPSHSRSDSMKMSTREDGGIESELKQRWGSTRSRSNSALGAPTVMAGIVAAGVAAGWSPTGRVTSEEMMGGGGGGGGKGGKDEEEEYEKKGEEDDEDEKERKKKK
ncbi:hypothetical protein CP533_6420, partial [Ophiocordyceps camponoti-saundersi (nom. inval.)]